MRLPGEDELRDSIRSQLASEFQVASRLLDIGTSIFLNPVNLEPDGELDPFELHICLGIVFKACRQYRGIVAVAEISLGDVAESNGRMLLETMLTAEFLMRPVVTLKRGGKQLARCHHTVERLRHEPARTERLKTHFAEPFEAILRQRNGGEMAAFLY